MAVVVVDFLVANYAINYTYMPVCMWSYELHNYIKCHVLLLVQNQIENVSNQELQPVLQEIKFNFQEA